MQRQFDPLGLEYGHHAPYPQNWNGREALIPLWPLETPLRFYNFPWYQKYNLMKIYSTFVVNAGVYLLKWGDCSTCTLVMKYFVSPSQKKVA